jgi:hypothetical protein
MAFTEHGDKKMQVLKKIDSQLRGESTTVTELPDGAKPVN